MLVAYKPRDLSSFLCPVLFEEAGVWLKEEKKEFGAVAVVRALSDHR